MLFQKELRRLFHGENKRAVGAAKTLGSYVPLFSPQIEDDLCEFITENGGNEKNGIQLNFNKTKQLAVEDWFYSDFMTKHPQLTLHQKQLLQRELEPSTKCCINEIL